MLNKIISSICSIMLFIIFHNICRMSAAYFPKSKIKKYIIINNRIVAPILIARQISRDKFVSYLDFNKMSVMGLITYIIMEPINIYALVLSIKHIYNFGNIERLRPLYEMAYTILGGLVLLVAVLVLINTNRCNKN